MHLKGLIFDFDGLILDTEIAEFQSWSELFQSYGFELPFSKWSACIGTSNKAFNVYDYFEEQAGQKINWDDVSRVREERLYSIIASMQPFPGVRELILEAKSKGLKIALASSSPFSWVSSHLSRLNLISYFDSIHTKEEVQEVKPDPALYLNALKAIGLKPDQAIALEDSPNGIKAAKNAGLYCMAVPNQLTMMMDTSQADIVVPSLKGIDLDYLNGLLEKRTITIKA